MKTSDGASVAQQRGRRRFSGDTALALWGAVAAISLAGPLFRLAVPTHPLVSAGIRLVIAAALLLPWTLRAWPAMSPTIRRAALLGGALYAVHFGAWVWSLTLTTVAASVSLVTATPLMLAVWSLVQGRDKPSPTLWAALGVAAVGIAMIGGVDMGQGAGAVAGDALALLGAMAMAIYLAYVRTLGEAVPVMPFMGLCTAVGGALLLSVSAALGLDLTPAHAQAGWALFAAALLPQLVGHGLLTWSLRHATPTRVGVATLGEPVGASLLAWWLFAELPSTWTIVGCVFTGGAVLAATLRR